MRRPDITAGDLKAAGLGPQFEAIEDAVADHLEGAVSNVAVVSEPFAGRDAFLDYAEEALGVVAGRVTLEEVVTEVPEFPPNEVVLVDNCHYLYTRQIGGFDVLDEFLEKLVASDALFVTSWNCYSWAYLTSVRDVERAFPTQIDIPHLDADQVANLLDSYHGRGMPEFVQTGEEGRVKTVGTRRYPLPVGSKARVHVPLPELNLEYLLSRTISGVEESTEAVVYQKIAQLSEGDPGVATVLWDRSIRDGEIAPAYVQEVDRPPEVDDDEAFVLEIVLSNEGIDLEMLRAVAEGIPVDRSLQTLVHQGLVDVDTGSNVVQVVPERLYSTVEHLEARQLIW